MIGTFKLYDNLDPERHFYRTTYVCNFNCYHIDVKVMANDGTNSTVVDSFILYSSHKKAPRRPWMDELHRKITDALRAMESGLLEACQQSTTK